MMKNLNKVILLILLINSVTLFSVEYILKDINVNGLKRTRYGTILKLIDLKKGELVDISVEEKVKQALLSAGIFQNDISVNLNVLSDSEAVLNIVLLERWTLIPIPVGFVSSDSWLAGGVFIESNLLGLNQTLVAGVFANADNVSGFSAWNNPTFLDSKYSFGLSTSFYSGLQEHLDISGDEVYGSFNENKLSFTINGGITLPFGIGLNLGTGLELFEIEDSKGYLSSQDFSDIYIKNVISLKWENLFYSSFFNEGWTGDVKTTVYTTSEEYISPLITGSISRSLILDGRHLLKLKINAGWHNTSEYNPLLIGGTEGSRVLPSGNVAVKRYSNGLISFEPVILNPTWGIFTLPIYYEGGIYEQNSEYEFWHGPGIGFRFYVDKVAIPALGADFTWDLERGIYKVAVSIGGTGGGN